MKKFYYVKKIDKTDGTLTAVLLRAYKITLDELSELKKTSSVSVDDIFNDNKEAIESMYVGDDKGKSATQDNIPLSTRLKIRGDFHVGAQVYYPVRVREQFVLTGTNSYAAFMGEEIKHIISSELYKPTVKNNDGTYHKTSQALQVHVFSKALGKLTNITPYVGAVNTNVGNNGGNFTISVASLQAFWDKEADTWKEYSAEGDTYHRRVTGSERGTTTDPDDKDVAMRGTPLYFDKIFMPNDLVFISYEELAIYDYEFFDGKKYRTRKTLNNAETLADIEGGMFDMIGLIDGVSTVKQYAAGSTTLSVTGRDLSKVILEDGVYFFPVTESSSGFLSNYFANVPNREEERKSFSRVFGSVNDLTLFTNQRLSTLIQYIYDKFTNIRVLPDTDFSGVGDGEKGIFNYIDLVIDEEVGSRKLVDDSIATDSGSTFNFLSKIIQMPFVELIQDTYGDRFKWIVRKPPFTRDSYLEQFRMVNDGNGITIEPNYIIDSNLRWDDENTFSWYRVQPLGYYLGDTYATNFALPAVYFPELADMFGNKPLDVTSNYLDYGNNGQEGTNNIDVGFQQGMKDLKYIIESNVYLPFTKKGSITIHGNRTIKRGMVIKVRSMGMYFYVDTVTQIADVNAKATSRRTVLQVSRGMSVKDYDRYFELVDYGTEAPVLGQRKVNWKIDTKVLDWMVKRKNFTSEAKFINTRGGAIYNDFDDVDTSNLA